MAPQDTADGNGPIVIAAAQPLRVSWPLDVGPDERDGRLCLRARQGANELQEPGTGRALYAFRLASPGRHRTWFRVRWGGSPPGSILCDNSWFARFDDGAPEVIGNETAEPDWFWQPGPELEFGPGLHWLQVELREDGPMLDRVAVVPASSRGAPGSLDALPPVSPHGLAGQRPPQEPDRRLQDTEFCALPTQSLVIGNGHLNEITVCASFQAVAGPGFRGTIEVQCPTAPGLVVRGDRVLAYDAATPYIRRVLTLEFPAELPRRVHPTTVTVQEAAGTVVLRTTVRFVKPCAWAFLGPFRDTSAGSHAVYRFTGAIRRLQQPCDDDPARLAARSDPATLGLAGLPAASGAEAPAWRVIADGSCYDWSGAVDLLRVYGPTPPAFAYAVTWIEADAQLNHRSFLFQADDSGWLWVSGHLAVELPVDLPREANRLWTSVPLHPGVNPVVVKLTQNQMYWGFRFDEVDWHWQGRRGDTLTGAEPEAWPR